MRDEYVHGQWNAICDRCGFKFKSGQLRKEWTNLRVCQSCWEPRHPQDFVKARADNQRVPWARPEAPDTFIEPGDVTGDDL